MAAVTAVDGGHIQDLSASNDVIRRIVEARNATRGIDIDEERETQDDIEKSLPIDAAEPLVGIFDHNPKDVVGSTKVPLSYWPGTATALGAIALFNGALKYGRSNWRVSPVRASIYVDACLRHVTAWHEGSHADEDGVPHIGAALACLAILADAAAAGTLIDDRNVAGGHAAMMDSLTPLVSHLREIHSDKNPRHFTIKDSKAS